jgi:hypothetical protein
MSNPMIRQEADLGVLRLQMQGAVVTASDPGGTRRARPGTSPSTSSLRSSRSPSAPTTPPQGIRSTPVPGAGDATCSRS